MGKLKVISNTFNSLTGRSWRHNKALRETTDLLDEIQEFYSNYKLQEGNSDLKPLMENIGYAKFDLTNLTYHIRPMVGTAKDIIGVKVSPAMKQILSQIEDLRRALMDPALRRTQLREAISELHESVADVQHKLSEIEYK